MADEITIEWESRTIRLSYMPRYLGLIDHVEIRSEDGDPLPITETGYKSYFFGPVEPSMTADEIAQMVIAWLDKDACSKEWRDYMNASRQLSLF